MSSTTLSLIVRVQEKTDEAEGVARLVLVDPHGRDLPAFSAGSHIDVQTAPGVIRQYSLCNPPWETDRYQIGVLREPQSRGGSQAMHESVREGDLLHISAPRNHFELAPAAKKSLLFAGGIGVTPILAMAEHLARAGKPFELHYSARSQQRMAFHTHLSTSGYADRINLYFDEEGQTLDVDKLVEERDEGTHVYVCGPGGYIDFILGRFKAAGWPASQLHTEYFAGQEADTSADQSFEVRLARSEQAFMVPADKTVAEVLLDNDIDLLTSCEQGVCGTCVTKVLEGTPDHRDLYLDDEEHAANDCFTPCCSRAKSRVLVIDL